MTGTLAGVDTGPRSRCFRGIKFAIVGAIGICVQLAILGALTSVGINYLVATVIAVESAIIHNFCWHRRFTWDDRAAPTLNGDIQTLLRFHLSNGTISLLGNVVLMFLLVTQAALPVAAANMTAIVICACANFLLSDLWVCRSGKCTG